MKKISIALFGILTIFFMGCEGSDTYKGSWKATDSKGAKFDIKFDAKKLIVKDASGEKATFDYSQNSVNINNSVET